MSSHSFDRFAAKGSAAGRAAAYLSFIFVTLMGLAYCVFSLTSDMAQTGAKLEFLPFALLCTALLAALVFEFVNGFHDTANAVATVIYTNSMPPTIAVMWSGFFNFLGVLLSSGAVAFGIIALLPVELILQVGSAKGFAMVFALLIAAVMWNLGTWYFGLPASSSHTLIGSIIGVGLANGFLSDSIGSGVDWSQVAKVGYALLFSPLVGFCMAALLLLLAKKILRNPSLYVAPEGNTPPPWWIRGIAIFTCTGVSFAHGSNDGQKGMGLIMLILVGMLPMSYAFNQHLDATHFERLQAQSRAARDVLPAPAWGEGAEVAAQARQVLSVYLSTKSYQGLVLPALSSLLTEVQGEVRQAGGLNKLAADRVSTVRKDLYLITESARRMKKDEKAQAAMTPVQRTALEALREQIDEATHYIPVWVKIVVALALGLGTMVGWKRIVITVGEKIGKARLTYAQGASAEIVTMLTISAANIFGLPVSTTHVLSSAVTGTMVANKSGVQFRTVRNILMAWFLTLPAAICLSAGLYTLFHFLF